MEPISITIVVILALIWLSWVMILHLAQNKMTQQEKQLRHYMSLMEGALRIGDFQEFEAYQDKVKYEIEMDRVSWPAREEYNNLTNRYEKVGLIGELPQN